MLDPNEATDDSSSPTEANDLSSEVSPKRLTRGVAVSIGAFFLVIALAFVYNFTIDPWFKQREAAAQLNSQIELKPIMAKNSEYVSFENESDEEVPAGVNPKQLALAEKGSVESTAVFIFESANANENTHTLDVYMDFYSQRSRDFITINSKTISNLMASGKLTLRIHPVLNKEAFSIYAPEALAEIFCTAPERAWSFFTDLLKESITLAGNETPEEAVAFIANHAKANGAVEVDEASIGNATFLTWLYTAASDPKVSVGYTPPVLYIDGKEVDQELVSINNAEQMLKIFSTLN